jgi:hypothetical protein
MSRDLGDPRQMCTCRTNSQPDSRYSRTHAHDVEDANISSYLGDPLGLRLVMIYIVLNETLRRPTPMTSKLNSQGFEDLPVLDLLSRALPPPEHRDVYLCRIM